MGTVPALTKANLAETAVPEVSGLSDFILGVKLQDAETRLRLFKTDLASHFPFVIVPDGSVENLYRLRPVLVMGIIVAASFRSLSQQRVLAGNLLEYLSLHVLLRGEKSLDLLQGLLILAAWYVVLFFGTMTGARADAWPTCRYQCQFSLSHSAFTSVLHLATGLLSDLGLNQPAAKVDRHNFVLSAINGAAHGVHAASRQRTNEERRALLGCFYVTSVYKCTLAVAYISF